MNKSLKIWMGITVLLSITAGNAQIKNAKTESLKIFGNCGMCESSIEKAGNVKNVVDVEWSKDTKMATITYDAGKTNQDEILKRIALAGYDSDQFLAPDDVYAKLPECCQYERENKTAIVEPVSLEDHSVHHQEMTDKDEETEQDAHPMKAVFDTYFALKDALVQSDGHLASEKAKLLHHALKAVPMNTLSHEVHTVWMNVMNGLILKAKNVEETKDISLQRSYFITLSDPMYLLLKVSKQETPVYYQHCPMANSGKGANWLSKESAIKNPYYGAQMLTCGSTLETID